MPTNQTEFAHRQSPFSKQSTNQGTRSVVIYMVFALLVVSNIALGLALTMGSELSLLWTKTKDPVMVAYQTRILQLRMEVDRLHSQQYLQTGNQNLQLQELLRQQEILNEQHEYIRVLAQKAENLGLTTAAIQAPTAAIDNTTTASIFTRTPVQISASNQADAVQQSLLAMANSTDIVLDTLYHEAQSATQSIVEKLTPLGIAPRLTSVQAPGVGGPFVQAGEFNTQSATLLKTSQTMNALEMFSQARSALKAAPVHFPLANNNRISSPFGTRRDPFGGSRAFHSGIDYPAPTGTAVFSAGQGKVIFAGRRGGYGNLIEIEHANGIVSRYGHLSAILVRLGQQVNSDTKIGKVGSSGRSTGPHLHFEIRRDQTATNPENFLNVARELSSFIG